MATIGTIAVDVLLTGLGPANRSLDDLKGKSKGASDGLDGVKKKSEEVSNSARKLEKDIGGLGGAFDFVKKAALGFFAAFSIQKITQIADTWSDMQSKIGSSIKDMEAAPALMGRMVELANSSYSPLAQTVDVFSRNMTVMRDLGRTAAETADFTEALNHALVTTATRGQDADTVISSISRSLSKGKLDLESYDVIISRSPRVLEAIAEKLGTTTSGLRDLASQGKVTSSVIIEAIVGSLEKLREEAGEMPATINDAFTILGNNVTAFVGIIDKSFGASGFVAEKMIELSYSILGSVDSFVKLGNIIGSVVSPAIEFLSGNIQTVVEYSTIAVSALAGFYAPAAIAGLWSLSAALVTGVAGGIKAITLAMLANPLGLLIGGLAAAVTAAFMFRDEIKQAIGVDVIEVFRSGANTVIGAMVGAVEATKTAWEVLPDFMSGLGARAWNAFLSGFEGPAVSWTNPFTGEKFDLINLDLSAFKADEGGAGGAAVGAVTKAFSDAQDHDYVGDISASIGELWESASGAGGAIADLAGQLGEGGAAGGQGLSGAASAANDNIKELGKTTQNVLSEMYNFGKSVFSGFFSDLKSGLQEGQTFWEALGNAGANALDKIAQKALDMATTGIWDMIFGAVMGGLGGGSMGMFGIGGGTPLGYGGTAGIYPGFPSFAGGGSTGFGPRSGGVDGLGGFPAILHPNETVIDHTRPANQNIAAPQKVQIDVSISVDEGGNIVPLVRQVAGQEADIRVNAYNEGMADRVRDVGGNRWKGFTS